MIVNSQQFGVTILTDTTCWQCINKDTNTQPFKFGKKKKLPEDKLSIVTSNF